MRTCGSRFSLFCVLCILCHGVLALPAVSQDSKPDESAKENAPRAGVNGVGTPACIYCPPADYPEKAKLKRMQRTVVLDIEVTLQGKAKKIILVIRSGGRTRQESN